MTNSPKTLTQCSKAEDTAGSRLPIDAGTLIDALLAAGAEAAYQNFLLAQDFDVPIFPESIVQVHSAASLNERFSFSSVALEVSTRHVAQQLSGHAPGHDKFPIILRDGEEDTSGRIDLVCHQAFGPQVLLEVKDQISGTDDGLLEDLNRLQQLLRVEHKWSEQGVTARSLSPRFGALHFFIGKNAQQYRSGRFLASDMGRFADRTVNTVLAKLRAAVDSTAFELNSGTRRVIDSAKNGPPDPRNIGTEYEETVSGAEQFTYCVACVLHRKTRPPHGLHPGPNAGNSLDEPRAQN